MKLLLDQNISHRVVRLIQENFTGSEQVRNLGLQDSTDKEIWDYAKQHEFSIVTFDRDFFDFANLFGYPPKIIWIRTGNLPSSDIAELLNDNTGIIADFLSDEQLSCLQL